MYCSVALSFIAWETNSCILKFLLKLFTFCRMLNNNITFQIIFFFQVSAIGLNITLVFSLGGLSRFYGSDINFLILFFFLLQMYIYCFFFRHLLVTQVRKKLGKLVFLVIFLSVLVFFFFVCSCLRGLSLTLTTPGQTPITCPALLLLAVWFNKKASCFLLRLFH